MSAKCVVLGVTGGIAAYKACHLTSLLRKHGYEVCVIMTQHATEFVQPLTFETLSNNPVVTDMFNRRAPWEVEHIALAKKADIFVIAPATANIMAKMACGIADDMLSTTVLATKAPVLVAPAMNTGMWTAPATQTNVETLKSRGVHFVGPAGGYLACGDSGAGRMEEPEAIFEAIEKLLNPIPQDLAGLKVMVTAGATRERLDPVRYITNDSSGKMGFAIAKAAKERGADVTVICGSTTAKKPEGVTYVNVESTQDLYDAATAHCGEMDVIIQAAAPADYRFARKYDQKLKKQSGQPLIVELTENPDVAAEVGRRKKPGQTLVGFAAETEKVTEHAMIKLDKKNLDMIVANDVTQPGAGFNVDTNIATLITRNGLLECPLQTKDALAGQILDQVLKIRND